MPGKTDVLENKFLDFVFRGQTFALTGCTANWSVVPTLYVALGTAETDAAFTELPATGAYARVKACAGATQALTDFNGTHGTTTGASSGTDGIIETAIVLTFPTATLDWNTAAVIPKFAIYDALTGGNCLYSGDITTPRAVTAGTTASFAAGALSVTEG
jgi:hypothetical protein